MGASFQGMYLSGSLDLGLDIVLYEHGLQLVVSVNCWASYFIISPSRFKNLVRVPRSILLAHSFLCPRFFLPSEGPHTIRSTVCPLGAAACGEAVLGVPPPHWWGQAGPVGVCGARAPRCPCNVAPSAPLSWNCWQKHDSSLIPLICGWHRLQFSEVDSWRFVLWLSNWVWLE